MSGWRLVGESIPLSLLSTRRNRSQTCTIKEKGLCETVGWREVIFDDMAGDPGIRNTAEHRHRQGKRSSPVLLLCWICWLLSCFLTLCSSMDYSPPGSSVHGILQGRILERVAISFYRESSWSRDWTQVSCIAGRVFNIWATGKPHWIFRVNFL